MLTKQVFRLLAASVAALAWACSDPTPPAVPQDVTTTKGRFTVPGRGFIDGRDLEAKPPLMVMQVNVWDAVPRRRIVCTLPHGDFVELLESKRDDGESRAYFRVRGGQCEGWLAESFVSQDKESPIVPARPVSVS
jgi:hypothetical protein